jgi:hypothetical protein
VETKVTLAKASGTVSVSNGDTQLEGFAQQLINHNIQHRKTGDVTTLVQKMFSTRGDIFSIREQGGAYFVPAELRGFTEQVEKFVEEIGGEMSRFPVPKGTAEGTKAAGPLVNTASPKNKPANKAFIKP